MTLEFQESMAINSQCMHSSLMYHNHIVTIQEPLAYLLRLDDLVDTQGSAVYPYFSRVILVDSSFFHLCHTYDRDSRHVENRRASDVLANSTYVNMVLEIY